MDNVAAVILAAGKGTRMNEGRVSPIPKVMFEIGGVPMISQSVNNIKMAGIDKVVVVVGYKQEMVRDYLGEDVSYAVQGEQLGTGHAAASARGAINKGVEAILVCYGDMPLFQPATIRRLINLYREGRPTIAMLTVDFNDPNLWAYGRIIRNKDGNVVGIVEQKDCNDEQLEIKESNPGFYIFDAKWFFENCDKLKAENTQSEYYLTDMIAIAANQGKLILATRVDHEWEALGINKPSQLKEVEEILQSKVLLTRV